MTNKPSQYPIEWWLLKWIGLPLVGIANTLVAVWCLLRLWNHWLPQACLPGDGTVWGSVCELGQMEVARILMSASALYVPLLTLVGLIAVIGRMMKGATARTPTTDKK